MSLVSGPGKGGAPNSTGGELGVQKHVDYIKHLDTVRVAFQDVIRMFLSY